MAGESMLSACTWTYTNALKKETTMYNYVKLTFITQNLYKNGNNIS